MAIGSGGAPERCDISRISFLIAKETELFKALLANLTVATLVAMGSPSVSAQPVTVALSADITSMDPHFHNYSPNLNVAEHVFNRLVERNDQMRMLPGLALSWRAVDDLTWEFKLRPGVTFHDGSPFTADDVAFSIARVSTVKDSPGLLAAYTKEISAMEVVDPLTIRLKTAKPYPLLPNDMTAICIVSKKAALNATTADFNSGKAAIGTGPYKLARFARGDRIELVRNESYWGRKPPADSLTFRVIPNDAARVAALLSGDVQVVEGLPVSDIARLKSNPDVSVVQRASMRLIYMSVDVTEKGRGLVNDAEGNPLPKNPLSDVRVRQAISKAIDREMIRSRVMEGASRPTGQLIIPGLPGYIESVKPDVQDMAGAKKLMADAGYPNGFQMTIQGPNNRYVQDEQILQTVAQMLSRIGITAKVEAMPAAVYFPRANKGDFALHLMGLSPGSGEVSSLLRQMLATRNKEKGFGAFNAGNYSNTKLDELLETAQATVADAPREKLLQEASEIAFAEYGIIPLHHQVNLWGTRKNVSYGGRTDERTYGFDFVLQK
jgi:peptide/nickel transport system substrate-binding protein